MFLTYILLVAFTCSYLVKSETTIVNLSAEIEETTAALEGMEEEVVDEEEDDIEQSVALIDIVFMDGSKRTCTGAIIHDNVVLTAGHCFIGSGAGMENIAPELTASFVVIGTKNKFESGYEQYLPIERVITHHAMKGWKADLALIHTFASMTANKIGAIVPLANDKNYGPGDGNFTIMSWGRTMDGQEDEDNEEFNSNEKKIKEESYSKEKGAKEEPNSCDDDYNKQVDSFEEQNGKYIDKYKPSDLKNRFTKAIPIKREGNHRPQEPRNALRQRKAQSHRPSTKKVSRYLSSDENKNSQLELPAKHRYNKLRRNQTTIDGNKNVIAHNIAPIRIERGELETNEDMDDTRRHKDDKKEVIKTAEKLKSLIPKPGKKKLRAEWSSHWRRHMGTKEANKLTVETFGFIGGQPCKKMINKIVPQMHLNASEIICYASDDHYVTDEDSGAPAIRQGELVAITVGGIVSEGEHVAVGIKLSEYCGWMSENLPAGTESTLSCWPHNYNPSNDNHDSDQETERLLNTNKNKYLG